MKPLERLRRQYTIFCKITDPKHKVTGANVYTAMRIFCLDCELIPIDEIERMEDEIEQIKDLL